MEQAYTADMPEIIGDNPGGPDEVWGGEQVHLGPLLDVFVSEEITGTTERRERVFAAFLHRPGEVVDNETLQKLLEPDSHVPEGLVGVLGLLRLVQGMSGPPKGALEFSSGGKHVSFALTPTRPFNITSLEQSKSVVKTALESPKARIIGGSLIVGAAATAAFARLKQVRRQRKHGEPS